MLFYFWTGIDLNLPLDEFGAVDFDYLHNPHGKHAYIYIMLFFLVCTDSYIYFTP